MTAYPLLFIPGMMCDDTLWSPQIDHFSSLRQTVVADLSRGDSIEEMAKNALNSVDGDFIAIGLSMGGIIAFEMWRQAPERIKGLALLDTNAMAESDARKQERHRQIIDAKQGHLMKLLVDEFKPRYLAPTHRQDKDLLEKIRLMAEGLGLPVFEQQSKALMNRCDSMQTLPTITCPTEVLCGEDDELCPVEYHQMMAVHIPDARLTVLPDCGHLSSLEAPAVVNRMISDLIQRVET